MSRNEEENRTPGAGSSGTGAGGLNNDPGKASQRAAHANDSFNEDPSRRDSANDSEEGGLHPGRNDDANPGDYHKGKADQDGTQNQGSAAGTSDDTGAGSGNLTEESRASRTDKFGPEHRSDTTGI